MSSEIGAVGALIPAVANLPCKVQRDLMRLRYVTYWSNNRKSGWTYVFDKILLHYIPVSSEILNRDDARFAPE